jgi:hypothetical protein
VVYVAQPRACDVVIELLVAPELVPAVLVADTVNVYEVLGVRPVTPTDVVPLVVEPPLQEML